MNSSSLREELLPGSGRPAAEPEPLAPGTQIGRFVILRELGAGAMGTVHAAFDPRLKRSVALKRVRPLAGGSSAAAAEDRLVREARALARLSHPAVVAVHDAEWIDGRVTVAMELVEGTTLERWLKETPRRLAEVLPLLLEAARGLAAAHAAGIVHRDFKPSNVLVGTDGRARVSDFGLARDASGAEAPERAGALDGHQTLHLTRTGELVGTPAYMAPEQLSGESASARSDQFSYAVTLFEALTGTRPFSGSTVCALLHQIREGAVDRRSLEQLPSALRPVLLKALSQDPAERYASMEALCTALEAAQGLGGRKLWLLAVPVAAGLVACGYLLVTAPVRRCERGAVRAAALWPQEARDKVRAALAATGKPFTERVFSSVDGRLTDYARRWGERYVAACADRAHVEERLACLGSGAQQVDALVRSLGSGAEELAAQAAQAAAALPAPERCDAPAAQVVAQGPAADAAREAIAQARSELGLGRYATAVPTAALAQQKAREAQSDSLLAEASFVKARLEQRAGRYQDARRSFDEALAAAKPAHRRDLEAAAAVDLVRLEGDYLGRFEEGNAWWERARALVDAYGDDPELRIRLEQGAGIILVANSRMKEGVERQRAALALAEQSAASDPALIAAAHQSLASALHRTGQREDALGHAKTAVELNTLVLGPDHPTTALSLESLGIVQLELSRCDEAKATLRRVVDIRTAALSPNHPLTAGSRRSLGSALANCGDPLAGIAETSAAVSLMTQALGPDHYDVGMAKGNLGEFYRRIGKLEEAKTLLLEAIANLEKSSGPEHPRTLRVKFCLSKTYRDAKEYPKALELSLAILAAKEQRLGPDHPEIGDELHGIGYLRLLMRQYPLAVRTLERALQLRLAQHTDPRELGNTRFYLAQALWLAGGDKRRAVELATLASQTPLRGKIDEGPLEEIKQWVRTHPAP